MLNGFGTQLEDRASIDELGRTERIVPRPAPIGAAVVGHGYWGPNLARNLEERGEFSLEFLCDRDQTQREKFSHRFPQVRTTPDLSVVLEDPSVDAVVIATPPQTHFPLAKMALEAGKHVLVEKPLTLSIREGAELLSLTEKQHRTLMVDHTFLYSPAIQKLGELVRGGSLGELYSVESVRVNLGLFQRDTNVIWDLAPHDFSILLSLTDERPTHISAVGSKTVVHPKQQRAQESVAHIMLHYASGFVAHIHVSWISPVKVRQMTIIGSKQVAIFDQLAANQLVTYEQGVYPNEQEGESGPLFTYKAGEPQPVAYDKSGEDLARMIDDFAGAISSGATPVSNAALALDVVRLLVAADASVRDGGKQTRIRYGASPSFHLSGAAKALHRLIGA